MIPLINPGSILYHSESSEVHKPVTGQELIFAVSYSKPALEACLDYSDHQAKVVNLNFCFPSQTA